MANLISDLWKKISGESGLGEIEPESDEIPEPESSEVNLGLLRSWREKGVTKWTGPHDRHEMFLAFSYAAEETQWDPEILDKRKNRLPVLQLGFVNGMVLQVVNPVRENPPRGVLRPVGMGDQAKMDARILTGVMRADESRCDAGSIYLQAFEAQVRGSFGAWWYRPVEKNGEWNIQIESLDPVDVIEDTPAHGDPRWQMVRVRMSEYDYRRKYPHGQGVASEGVVEVWFAFVRDCVTSFTPEIDPITGEIVHKPEETERVRYFVFDNDSPELLSEAADYRGTELPIILESAPSAVIARERQYFPLTHHCAEQQRAHNFWWSEATFDQSSRPKNRWRADEDSLIDQQKWNQAATNPRQVLFHKKGAQVVPQEPGEPPVGMMNMAQAMLEEARAATGIYPDPTLQAKMDAPSGKAIKQQQAGAGIANYQHTDRHLVAIRKGAKVHVDLIRKYYNDDQIRESLGSDGAVSRVSLGPKTIDGVSNINLSDAEFLVDIDTGPSYATQREQAQSEWMDFAKQVQDPHATPLITYWLLRLSPLQGSEDVADWYMATLPPNTQEAIKAKQPNGGSGDPAENMKAMQQLITQLKDHLAQSTEALNHANQELATKAPEIQSRERIEASKQQAETNREHLRISADLHRTDVDNERDIRLTQIEAESKKELEALKAHFNQQLEQLKGSFMLEKQSRENASDASLAAGENANVEVIA